MPCTQEYTLNVALTDPLPFADIATNISELGGISNPAPPSGQVSTPPNTAEIVAGPETGFS